LLNEYVLPRYPLAVNVFNAFGLTAQQSDQTWRVTSLVGVFMHPVDWVMSPQVLGDGPGHLDLTNLGSLLNKLPGEGINGPDGITILPVTNGLNLEGLPFGSSLTLTASTQNGVGIGVGLATHFSATT